MRINEAEIGSIKRPHPYLIAEAGVNHEGDFERAISLVHLASHADFDAVKFQHFEPGTRGPNRELPFLTLTELRTLEMKAHELGLDFIVTPHDTWALGQLTALNVDAMKIGSGWCRKLTWINMALQTFQKLPFIISTGMYEEHDIQDLEVLLSQQDALHRTTVLHCLSDYPAQEDKLCLWYINSLKRRFQSVGYSDHSDSFYPCIIATALGARIIEKHITLESDLEGRQDTFCSVTPTTAWHFVRDIKHTHDMCRSYAFGERTPTEAEEQTREWVSNRYV